MSDPNAALDPGRPLRIAGRDEALSGEVVGRGVQPLRAPRIEAAALVQLLCGLLALAGLFVVVAEVASVMLAVGVTALVAGLVGVGLSMLREAGKI